MKRKITLLMFAAGSLFSLKSQILFQEDFTSPFNPSTNGWDMQNLSSNASTFNWSQGNGTVFPAYNGGINDYVSSNFAATSNTATGQTLSNWLITPTLNIVNGNVFEFATRTVTNPTTFADRLEVYLSTSGSGTNVGTSATSVGTFSTLLVSVNPNLTTTGYPGAWTVYTVAITGVATPTVGRVGFRYHVTNGGFGGVNSDYIGLDGVKYGNPCAQPTINIAQTAAGVCSGGTVSLLATTSGSVAVSSYTWSTGQNGSNIVVTPTASGVYMVSGSSAANCVGTQTVNITFTASPNVQAASYTVCSSPATTATLTATGATTYSWNTGSTSSSIAVTPGSTTVYTVTGYAAGGACPKATTATVTIGTGLSMAISASDASVCAGDVVTLTAVSAATNYSWSTGQQSSSITATITANTTFSVGGYSGTIPNVCAGGNSIQIVALPNPTISATLNPTLVCSGSAYTLTGTGANSYFWFNTATTAYTNNPLVLIAGTPGARSYTFVGLANNGCTDALAVTFTVSPTPTIGASSAPTLVCTSSVAVLTATGGTSYQWSGASTSTANPLSYTTATAGNKTFTVVGKNAEGCSDTTVVSITATVCVTTGIEKINGNALESAVFPNPFANELNLSGLSGSIQIYNALGQLVISASTREEEKISTQELPKGAYVLKAYNTSGENVKTIKLLKN